MSAQTSPNSAEMRPEVTPEAQISGADLEKKIEIADIFSESDKERLRTEILEEISHAEHPTKPELDTRRAPTAQPAQPQVKSETLVQIERLLEEDLDPTYLGMDARLRAEFKAEGERTASKIEQLLQQGKVQTHKIFKMILHWLKMIPGVNKFFIRQEAKIKTEKIINLHTNKLD